MERIRVKKLRGVVSMGLLIPVPPHAAEGDDLAEALGVEHYEPPIQNDGMPGRGKAYGISGPSEGFFPIYDVENFRKYLSHNSFEPWEPVIAREKIHGANGRFTYALNKEGVYQMFAGSRKLWTEPGSLWHRCLARYDGVRSFLFDNPGLTIWGEVYGPVQSLRYGQSEPALAVFDIYSPATGSFSDNGALEDAAAAWGFPLAPKVFEGPFDAESLLALAEGPSLVEGANHYREGIVIRPLRERWCPKINGRLQLKIVSSEYLAKN
jgi:RNA ligase (TIGR02306 family)